MESGDQVSISSKYTPTEERHPKAKCFDCFANTPCYNVIASQYCIRHPRPKCLSFCPFRKRLRMEFVLSRKAMKKFLESRGVRPIVEFPPEADKSLRPSLSIWELPKLMYEWKRLSLTSMGSDWKKYSISSAMEEKKASITEGPIPGIKEFPLTQESAKKHIEKETAKKKEEKQETVLMLKKKQRELRRLKDELQLQAEKQYCHYSDKVADYEKEKMVYLENLASKHNLGLKDLMKNGDKIYKNYRSEMKKLHDRKIKEIEKRAEINARLLQEELTRQKQLKQLKSSSAPKLIKKKAKERILKPIQEEEEETMDPITVHSDEKSPVPTSSMWVLKSGSSIKSKIKSTDNEKVTRNKQYHPSPPAQSAMDQKIDNIIQKLEGVWYEMEKHWKEDDNEPDLPDNELLIVRPTSILFKDFLPFDDMVETVNVYNPTKEAIDCGFYKSYVEPQLDDKLFEVHPELVMRIRPGGNQDFQVIFTTEQWDEVKDGIRGVLWFWSKVLKTNTFYRIPISVQCTRFSSNIKVDNPIIQFNQVPSWVHLSFTKYIEITNNSKIDYEVFIHRKSHTAAPLLQSPIKSPEITEKSSHSLKSDKSAGRDHTKQRNPDKVKHARIKEPESSEGLSQDNSQIVGRRSRSKSQSSRKLRGDGYLAAKDMLELMLKEVYQPFRVQLTRGVYLDGGTKMCVPIKFLPQLAENFDRTEEHLVVSYEGKFLSRTEEVVTLIATMLENPLSISPDMVDMQVTMVGTGVWQTSFQLTNLTKKFVKVKVWVPHKLTKHFQPRPKKFVIRPNEKEDVLLRAKIGWNIKEDSGSMLDTTLSLLEFPISVQAFDFPPQVLGALAVISYPLALSIEPKKINLGFVNTFETVVEEFWLHNHSVVPLNFAFINLPRSCMVMPMYGFSEIGPAQKIKLHLLYSPGVQEAGTAGGQAVHMFNLICTTLERLVADKPNLSAFNPEEEVVKSENIMPLNSDPEHFITLRDLLKMPKDLYVNEMADTHLNVKQMQVQQENLAFLNENISALSFLEKREIVSPVESRSMMFSKKSALDLFPPETSIFGKTGMKMDIEESDSPENAYENAQPFLTLSCMAIVTDPVCELSAQEILAPNTPYGSYSIHHIYLSSPNAMSGSSCHCKRFVGLYDNPAQMQINFHFTHTSGKELEVQPVSGTLNYGEKIKIYIILRPELNLPESLKEIKKAKLAVSRSIHKSKIGSKLQSKLESTVPKMKLLRIKNMVDTKFQARIKCLLTLKAPDLPEPRYDTLHCDLFATFTRPDIYIATPNSKKEIIYPKTAIGSSRVETIEVYNVSPKLVHVTRSHFSHKGIFICQPLPPSPWSYREYKGAPIEPDEYLKLRLTFRPIDENYVEEYFEVKANNTIVPLKVAGQGVTPRYTLSSQFCVGKMEAALGNRVEDTITITNRSDVELTFDITKCFQMETTCSDVFKTFLNAPTKTMHKENFLDPCIMTDIKTKFYESDQPSPITIEPHTVNIPPFRKASIKIVFHPKKPPVLYNITSTPNLGAKENMTHKIEEITPTFYMQKVQVVLGRLTLVTEWIIIGKVAKDIKKRI